MAGLRRIAVESFSKDPAEAVSHAEQRPCYPPAAAVAAGAPGGLEEGSRAPRQPVLHSHLQQLGQWGSKHYPFGLCWMVCWGLVYVSF